MELVQWGGQGKPRGERGTERRGKRHVVPGANALVEGDDNMYDQEVEEESEEGRKDDGLHTYAISHGTRNGWRETMLVDRAMIT